LEFNLLGLWSVVVVEASCWFKPFSALLPEGPVESREDAESDAQVTLAMDSLEETGSKLPANL